MTVAERKWTETRSEHSRQSNGKERGGQPQREVNVGGNERMISIAAGAALALVGLSRFSIPGMLAAAVGGGLIYRGATAHCPMYEALGVDTAHQPGQAAQPQDYFERGIHVEQSYLINKPPEELYQFWRNFENLPRIMSHLESVRVMDDKRSHWTAKAPGIAGGKVEWDAEIINDEPNSLLAWRSLLGADVDNTGSVRFIPRGHDRGTQVSVVLDYIPPAGRLGKWIARLFGEEPSQQIQEDLRNFKRMMETGEIATIQGQPQGTCGGAGRRHRGW